MFESLLRNERILFVPPLHSSLRLQFNKASEVSACGFSVELIVHANSKLSEIFAWNLFAV